MAEGRIRRLSIVKERKGGHGLGSLGRTDSTAIWFIQCVGCEYRLIDYLNPLGLPFTTIEVLLEKRLQTGGLMARILQARRMAAKKVVLRLDQLEH